MVSSGAGGFGAPADPLSPGFGAPNTNPTGFPMLPAGFPKVKAAGFCEPVPSKLNGLSTEKAFPSLKSDLLPNKLVPKLLAGPIPLSDASATAALPVVGAEKRGTFPVSPLLRNTEPVAPNAVAGLTRVSVDVFEVFDEVKKLGILELSAIGSDEPVAVEAVSDAFSDDLDGGLAEAVGVNEKGVGVGVDELESLDLEPPKLNVDLKDSEVNDDVELGSFVFDARLKGASVDDDGKENPLGLREGVAPNVNAPSLVEGALTDVDVGEKVENVGGFGIVNWGTALSVAAVEPKMDGVDDGVLPSFETLSNSDCTVIRRFL